MSGAFKALTATLKHETRLVGPVERMLLARTSDRRQDCIHPSELAHSDFCARAVYYRIAGWSIPHEASTLRREVIFEEGHEYHRKWQHWAWDLGILRGWFACMACGSLWEAQAPKACPDCDASRRALEYREVPVSAPKYLIQGHSDGDLGEGLLEIKSVGMGTIRMEAPELTSRHTHKVKVGGEERTWVDLDGIWRDIRRPFPSHLRQGAIYGFCLDRPHMLYLYEFKPSGAVKEFWVKHDYDIIADRLDSCLDIVYGLKKRKAPSCPHGECPACLAYEKLGATDGEPTKAGARSDDGGGPSEAGEGEPSAPAEAEGGPANDPEEPQRASRRRVDESVRTVHSLGELLGRASSDGGDRRGSRADAGRQGRSAGDARRGERVRRPRDH